MAESPVALKLLLHQLPVQEGERNMSESERSESYGTPMSSDDAAELEELRREAAVLREQLENAVGPQSGLRSARDVHQLEARIDSLAARNSKLMETLKEAASSCWRCAKRSTGWVSRRAATACCSGVQEDDTVDVFTSGRKMRLTCSPNIDAKSLKQGQTVRLNEALTSWRPGHFESVGEISTLREILADGHRALVVGHADEERIVWLAEPLVAAEDLPDGYDDERRRRSAAQAAPGDSLLVDTKAGYAFERIPKAEVEDLVLEEVPDVSYNDIGGPEAPDRADPRRGRAAVPAQGALPGVLAAAAQGRAALRASRLRQDADRQGGGQLAGQEDGRGARRRRPRGEVYFLNIKGPELLNKFVGETERHIRLIFQRAGRRRPRAPR